MKSDLVNPWDEVYKRNGNVLGAPYRGFAKYLTQLKKISAKTILDLGCGTGRHAIPLYKNGFKPYAFDISANAISQLRLELSKQGFDHTDKIVIADMFEKFPYADDFFDCVISIATIYHGTVNNIKFSLGEVKRILKSGGMFYFTTSVNIENSKSINSGSNYILVEKGTFLPLDGREKHLVQHYFDKDELSKILSGDFKDIAINFDGDNYFEVYCFKK